MPIPIMILSKQECEKYAKGEIPVATRYKDIGEFIDAYYSHLIGAEEISFVVLDKELIYASFESNYRLTYSILNGWLEMQRNAGVGTTLDLEAEIHHIFGHQFCLSTYLHEVYSSRPTTAPVQNDYESLQFTEEITPDETPSHKTGVDREYATYFTLFRGGHN